MNILIVLAHPKAGSFNHAIADSIRTALQARGDQVTLRDLHAESFDPVLTPAELERGNVAPPVVREHADAVLAADGIVIIHPNWRSQPPAILKGWVDRVFRQGVTYAFGPNGVDEMLRGKRAVVFTTSNTPRDVELKVYGDPLENLWKTVIFGLCGVRDFTRRNFESIVMSTPEQRSQWLAEVRTIVAERFPAA